MSRPRLATPAGLGGASPIERAPRSAQAGVPEVILLADSADPRRRLRGAESHWLGLPRQRAGSRETPHLWFCWGFTRPPAPRLATAPTNRPRRSLSSPGSCSIVVPDRARRQEALVGGPAGYRRVMGTP